MKCFDMIHRDKLWTICINNGISGHLLNSMTAMYNSAQACVRAGGVTDSFNCPVGPKQ